MTVKYRLYVQKGRSSGEHRVAMWRNIRSGPYEKHFMRQNGTRYADCGYMSTDIGMYLVRFLPTHIDFLSRHNSSLWGE